jgi:hypothetical protein
MATRNLVPRNSGEGSVGKVDKAWATGVFDNLYIGDIEFSMDQNVRTSDSVEFISGNFVSGLTLGGVDVASLGTSVSEIQSGSAEFCFFSDITDNIGVTQKTYHNTPNPNTYLSEVTVATAEDLKIYFQWDGPNEDYIGEAFINGQKIPDSNIQQLGTDTRRFIGYLDNVNATGLTGITGSANGRTSILPMTELGGGPTPTNILIDEIDNATAKPGELLGTTHLKQGDEINIYVDFNRDDVDLIKVHDFGLAQEINYTNYSLQDLGGTYRATIPVTVSNRNGSLSVAVQAIDSFGSTGDLKEASDFGHTSGTRDLDQLYPSINASDPTSYNGRTDGLREGESTTFSNSISNWTDGVDFISYEILDPQISMNNLVDFEATKTVNYVDGIYSNQDNIEIYAVKTGNGATDTERVNVKIANGPVIVSTQLDSTATSATSPHIVGTSQLKQGDIVNSKVEVDGKGVSINNISVSVANQGVSNGSQTSYSSSYTKATLPNGNFEIFVPINVFGTLGSSSRDGDQPVTFTVRNNFGTLSDSATSTDTAELHNATRPSISFGAVNYPAGQQAIKSTESVSIENVVVNQDIISYTSPNNQLSISNSSTYETNKSATYSSGGYNIDGDGGVNNTKITATRTANGAVTESFKIVNIANTPLTININNLASKIKTSTSATSDNFNLSTNQLMLNAPSLSVDASQTSPSSLSQTSSGTGKFSNAYSLTVTDADTKGTFNWSVSAFNLAGIETTSISSNPTYTLEGFTSRTIIASPTSLGAGLAPIGTTVTNGNNITFENVSEGGTAPNGGTLYTYQSYSDGIQLDNSYDTNNKFTVCDSNGLTDSNGDHVFNLDKLNRAANSSTSNPATFVLSE